jgi:Kef-type K+ transport system membrane component KefB
MASLEGWSLALIGLMLLAGYAAHLIGPKIYIPNVSLLLLAGVVCGPAVLGLVPDQVTQWFPFVAHMALAMVGFLLGESFVGKEIKEKGRMILGITIGETIFTVGLVLVGLLIVGTPVALALVLAGIAPASAPAAIFETVREGECKGPLTDTVLGVVAIDDALGVILFSILLVVAQTVTSETAHYWQLVTGLWEVCGAVLVGIAISFPMLWATTKVRKGRATLAEAGGFVFLCAGIASALEVSYLLSTMVLGAIMANRGHSNLRPFHEIEGVREPFLAVFFVLAGLGFQPDKLTTLGVIGLVYIAARTVGLILGGNVAGKMVHAPKEIQSRIGWCILTQAGVALGFALLAQERLPQYSDRILPLVVGTTIIFEISGPIIARWHLQKAGELRNTAGG